MNTVAMPLISFIVPMYHVATYLETCLQSILQQSVSKEIILVNDGSRDETLTIAMRYAEHYPEIKLIHYHHNRGQSYARNQALALASGEYIYCVDSDDTLVGDELGKIIDFARKYQEQADLIRFQAQYEYEFTPYQVDSVKAIPNGIANFQNHLIYRFSGYECLNQLTRQTWTPAICWTLIKRDFLQKHALRFLEGVQAEDQLFYIQLLTCKPDVVILEFPHIIYRYRIRRNSTVFQRSSKYILDHLTICAKIQEWNQAHDFDADVQESLKIIQNGLYTDAYRMFWEADSAVQAQLAQLKPHFFKK